MNRLRLPLYAKILAWFALNLAVLALLMVLFLKAEFGLGLDWLLSGEPGDRIAAMGDRVTQEFSRAPETEWNARLRALGGENGVHFALFNGLGEQVHGESMAVPAEVRPRLVDRRPPSDRPPRPMSKRPVDAPPKPRFMLRAGEPARYWAGVHLDLVSREGRPLSLVMAADSISGGGLFLDLWPWMGLTVLALLLSALLWLPFVHGVTRFVGTMNIAAGCIAQGNFDERIEGGRGDELGELAQSVNAMAERLGEYVREQKRITADVAHELCSPIARMQMALGIVEQRASPEQADPLRRLDQELQHMARLVEEVLAFTRAESLPDQEIPETIDLRELLQGVVQREAPDEEVRLDVGDVSLHSLRGALDRAIGNVVRNAVRYACDVEVHVHVEPDQIHIRVLDRGPGVPEAALRDLFKPFYRPDGARRRASGGSGLGLAITKRCIEACGGRVHAENRQGGGLLVTISVPACAGKACASRC